MQTHSTFSAPLFRILSLLLISLLVTSCSRMPTTKSFTGLKSNLIGMKNNVVRATPRIFKPRKPRYPAALPLRGYPAKKVANTHRGTQTRSTQAKRTRKKSRYPAALSLRKTANSRTCPTPNRRVVLARGSVPRITAPQRKVVTSAKRSTTPGIVKTVYTPQARRQQPQQVVHRQAVIQRVPQAPRLNPQQANHQLFNLAKNGNAGQISNLLSQGANVNAGNGSGETALHAAASTGNTSAAQALLQRGANVNARTVRGWTPLHTAARFGRGNFAALLLNNGAQRNIQNVDGKTPMQLARQANQHGIVAMLQR
ncbi:MAG: ankyrin repeat domain-containing protein [Thiotrichaceae bacterium]